MNGDSRASVARTPRCLKLKDRRNAFNFASDPRSPRAVAGLGRILSFPTIVPLSPATWLGAFHAGHDESVLQLEKSCPDFRPICRVRNGSQILQKIWLPPRDSNPDMLIQSQHIQSPFLAVILFRFMRLPGYRFRRCAVKCAVNSEGRAPRRPRGAGISGRSDSRAGPSGPSPP